MMNIGGFYMCVSIAKSKTVYIRAHTISKSTQSGYQCMVET